MGLFDALIDVAILGTQISQRNKLHQLQQQHADATAIQGVIQILRQGIFQFKQTAEDMVALERTNPSMAAGALEILWQRFQLEGLVPDLFPELSDKEYVATTTRYLRDQRDRLLSQLALTDQLEVKNVASAAMRLPQYKEYLENYNIVMRYRDALPVYEKLKGRQIGTFFLLFFGSLVVMGGIVLSFAASLMGNDSIATVFCLSTLFVIGGAIFLRDWFSRPAEFKRVKEIVDTTTAKVDLAKFAALEKEYGSDDAAVRQQQLEAQQLVSHFFADGNFSALLSE